MSLYLQVDDSYGNVWWMLGALVVLGIVYFLTRKAQHKQQAEKIGKNDPRQNVVNDSSYNIDREGIDGHRAEGFSADEAERTAREMKDGGQPPSEAEFGELRRDIKKDK